MKRLSIVRRVRPDDRLTIVEHLDELRRRIIISVAALIAAFALTFAFHQHLLSWLQRPLPDDQVLVTLAVSEAFFTVVKISAYAALIVALPIWLYHLYAFIIPAVSEQPRRKMLVSVAAISALFFVGAAFGYFLVLPVALDWLQSFGDDLFATQLRAQDYYSFVSMFVLASGLMFELPVAMLGLARMGIVKYRVYIDHWRVAVVIIAVVAAALPGGDPFSMLMLMAPQVILYALGIWLAKTFGRPAPWSLDEDPEDAATPSSHTTS